MAQLNETSMKQMLFVVMSIQKTASVSVFSSLIDAFPHAKTLHAHYIARLPDKTIERMLSSPVDAKGMVTQLSHAFKVWRSIASYKYDSQYFVTMVRDPIARLYSDIFHKYSKGIMEHFDGDVINQNWFRPIFDKRASFLLERQRNYYKSEFGIIDIDFLASPSPCNGGLSVSQQAGRTLIIMRVEDLSVAYSQLMEILGNTQSPELRFENEATERGGGGAYQALKRDFPLNRQLLDQFYALPEIQHCYQPEEIDAFRNKWLSLWSTRR